MWIVAIATPSAQAALGETRQMVDCVFCGNRPYCGGACEEFKRSIWQWQYHGNFGQGNLMKR